MTAGPLTVVVPLYNGAATICDCLESLRRQTVPLAEVIVVDDGSTDVGADLAEAHPLNPRVVRQPVNLGVAVARNTGLIEASTERVAFLDQDDLWLPTRHERLLAILEQHPNIDVLATSEQVFAAEEDKAALTTMRHPFLPWVRYWAPRQSLLSLLDVIDLPESIAAPSELTQARVMTGSVTVTTSFVLPRRLCLQLGGFATWVRSADDWVLLQVLTKHASIYTVDEASVLYRVHASNTSVSTDWGMPLFTAAAAVRFGGIVIPPGHQRDPEAVGTLADSNLLIHYLAGQMKSRKPGARLDAWVSWRLLAAGRDDKQASRRILMRNLTRSVAPGWVGKLMGRARNWR